MLDFASTELLVVAIIALLVIGPKDLPKAMRFVGQWVGKARGVARQFRAGMDTMMRESELAEMEAKWKAENERIMREHPAQDYSSQDATTVDVPPVRLTDDADQDVPHTTPQPVFRNDPELPLDTPTTPPARDEKLP